MTLVVVEPQTLETHQLGLMSCTTTYWLSVHFSSQQNGDIHVKLTQYCKSTTLQFFQMVILIQQVVVRNSRVQYNIFNTIK